MPDLRDLTLEHFRPFVGDDFRCTVGDDKVPLRLAEAEPIPTAQKLDPGRREPFALTFEGPAEPRLEQGTYPLEQEHIGLQQIFLVPVAEGRSGRSYEAVFT